MNIGCTSDAIAWFRNYLTDRDQRVITHDVHVRCLIYWWILVLHYYQLHNIINKICKWPWKLLACHKVKQAVLIHRCSCGVVIGQRSRVWQADELRQQVFRSTRLCLATQVHVSLAEDTGRPSRTGCQSARWCGRLRMQASCREQSRTPSHWTVVCQLIRRRLGLDARSRWRCAWTHHPADSAVSFQ